MNRRQAVLLVVAATLALGAASMLGLPVKGGVLRLYLVAVAAVVLVAFVSAISEAVPPAPPSIFDEMVRGRPPPAAERPAAVTDLERLLAGGVSAGDLHFRLRPLLREIACSRLRLAHGIDLDGNAEAACRLLGEPTWELVRPDREPPADRFAPGLGGPALLEVVDALERIEWRR